MAKTINNTQKNIQQVMNTQTIVNMSVVMVGAQKVEADVAKVATRAETLKKTLEGSGLGGLDLSGVFKGGGLAAPFVASIQAAIVEENKLAEARRGAQGPELEAPKLGETAQNLKRLSESVESVSVKFGQALLPVVNALATAVVPLLTSVGEFVAANPNLVQGLLAGALAFTAMRSAVTGVMAAMTLLNSGFLASPIGWVALGIAAAAALIIAYWEPISAFFKRFWPDIERAFAPLIPALTSIFNWTPLGLIISNWGAISGYFVQEWDSIKQKISFVWEAIKASFAWTPLGLIIANWQPLVELFAAILGYIQALAVPVVDFLKDMFDFSPLGMIIKHWEPITKWFSEWSQTLRELMAPVQEWLGGSGGFIAKVTGKIEGLTTRQEGRNVKAPEYEPSSFWASQTQLPGTSSVLSNSANTLIQQTAATNRTQLEGGLTVRFDNAPTGLRVDQPQTNQPGLSVTPRVGYRSLSLGEAYG